MRRFAALLAASAVLAAGARAALAQQPEPTKPPPPAEAVPPPPVYTLTADVVNYDQERDLYEATGNVRIVQRDGRVLTADWALFNGTTRTGVASGDVVVVGAQTTVRAQFAAIDLNSTVSVALQGTMDSPQPNLSVRGDVIERTGVDTYAVERGTFTSCRCPPEEERRPWEISAKDASLEVGGYAVAKDMWFRVFGYPVLYLPWITFPVKTERQTGFMMPGFTQSSRNGTEIDIPFFWAIGDQLNLMLRPLWYGKRGFGSLANFEYFDGETGMGRGGAFILPNDRKVNNSTTDFFSDNRWSYWLRHQEQLTFSGIEAGTDIMAVSDNNIVFDFPILLGSDVQHQRQLESAAWLTGAQDGFGASALLSVNNDLQNPNDLDRDGYLLQRLPDLRASFLPRSFFGIPLRAGISARYTNFVQFNANHTSYFGHSPINKQFYDTGADGRFDGGEPTASGGYGDPNAPFTDPNRDPNLDDFANPSSITKTEGDGQFQAGELLADAGNRLDFFPKISLPAQLGIFEGLAEAGVRETLWFPNFASSASRTLYTLRGDLRTEFGRRYAIGTLPLEHIIEPRVRWAGVFAPNQDDKPLFIPAPAEVEPRLVDGDIRLVTDDPTDRVKDASLLQIQLANLLYGPSRASEGSPARRYGEFTVGSGYDFHKQAFTRLFALLDFNPSPNLDVSVDGGWDPEQRHLEDLRAGITYLSEAGHQLRIGYHYNANPGPIFEGFQNRGSEFDAGNTTTRKVNQVDVATYLIATRWLELFAEGFRSLEADGSSGGRVGTVLISTCKCWDLLTEFEKASRTNDKRFRVQFRLTGLGESARATDVDQRRRVRQKLSF